MGRKKPRLIVVIIIITTIFFYSLKKKKKKFIIFNLFANNSYLMNRISNFIVKRPMYNLMKQGIEKGNIVMEMKMNLVLNKKKEGGELY
jgi:hypothetical protein